MVTKRMELLYLNAAARSLARARWFGKRCWEVFPGGDKRCASRCPAVRAAASGRESIYCEETVYSHDGSPIERGVAAVPFLTKGENGERALLLFRPKEEGKSDKAFRNELLEHARILSSSFSWEKPGSGPSGAPAGAGQRFSPSEMKRLIAERTFFRGASRAAAEQLCAMALQKTVPAGCNLFSAGQTCDSLHFVIAGSGLLVLTAPDGRQRLLCRAVPGDMIGAVPFFDEREHPASFVAESDCVVLSFPRDQLMELLAADSALCLSILGGLVEKLRKMVSLVEKISFEDIKHRLWGYLASEARELGGQGYPRVLEPLPTRERMAQAIGTVREVVSRQLSHLAGTGHLQIEGKRLILLKPLS
ncbi:MAG: Crp/Fnr family transcriptional regulator [Planctomycetes bacterium]|nr:Crp/Fnr family transcriptional regulator [Planctomycetota bacterium]